MERAVQIVYDMSADGKTRELARWREKSMLDMRSSLYAAETRGEARGIGIGEARKLVDNVSKFMKGTGKSLEEILAILEVSQSEYDQSLALLNR